MRMARILNGHVLDVLRTLPEASVQCCVTSPPYWGLRDYGLPATVWGGADACEHEWGEELRLHKGGPHGDGALKDGGSGVIEAQAQVKNIRAGAFCRRCGAWRGCLGLEPTYPLYIDHMVEVFAEVHRVLRPDGTLWLNLGDCYATGAGAVGNCPGGGEQGARWAGSTSPTRGDGRPTVNGRGEETARKAPRSGHEGKHGYIAPGIGPLTQPNRLPQPGLKPKDLVGVPWRVAFALQDDGWWLRSDVIWSKPNPMPESVTDRPTKSHEYLFLLAKGERYFYDKEAIAEDATGRAPGNKSHRGAEAYDAGDEHHRTKVGLVEVGARTTRNKRDVWIIGTQPYDGAHFAVMPEALAEPCVLAGSGGGAVVLDPFCGSGTVGVVALRHDREFVGIELNPAYAAMARERICGDAPLLNRAEVAG